MFPCCGYDPGLAACLSSLDEDDHVPVAELETLDTGLVLACLLTVGLVCASVLMVV